MTSQINPSNIDGTYPVAGQENNSQGFRTNFTNISTNFQYASQEITDLQNKVVLKTALTGTTLNNDMQGSVLSNAQLQNMSETVVAISSNSGTIEIDYSAGSYQTFTMSGNSELDFTNWPVSGTAGTVSVRVTVSSTSYTLTFPTAVSVNNRGIQGLDSSTNIMSFAATGTYTFTFTTIDNGTTIVVNETNKALQPFNNSGETLTGSGQACSLAVTGTKFATTGAWTATLANGVSGQIKEFIMTGRDTGDMVITVANAGWKTSGSGTMTFSAIGQGCILRFSSDSKWNCVGNNGVTFA